MIYYNCSKGKQGDNLSRVNEGQRPQRKCNKGKPPLGKTLDIKHKMCYNVYENRGRKTSQTRKAFIMKKSTLQSLVSYLNGETITNLDEIRDELVAELNKGEAKAQANRDLYAQAKDIVLNALSDTPVTIGELYAEVENDLPEGFSKGKVQYAITRLWADEVEKTEGKVNTYALKA